MTGEQSASTFEAALSHRRLVCVIATAKATVTRAALLLTLAKASPEAQAVARGIYDRASRRLQGLQRDLDSLQTMLIQGQEALKNG